VEGLRVRLHLMGYMAGVSEGGTGTGVGVGVGVGGVQCASVLRLPRAW
jgi:hypothetical protein